MKQVTLLLTALFIFSKSLVAQDASCGYDFTYSNEPFVSIQSEENLVYYDAIYSDSSSNVISLGFQMSTPIGYFVKVHFLGESLVPDRIFGEDGMVKQG